MKFILGNVIECLKYVFQWIFVFSSLIIPLSSSVSEKLFPTSCHKSYDCLNPNFEPQEQLSYFGVACATILLNTLLPSQPK